MWPFVQPPNVLPWHRNILTSHLLPRFTEPLARGRVTRMGSQPGDAERAEEAAERAEKAAERTEEAAERTEEAGAVGRDTSGPATDGLGDAGPAPGVDSGGRGGGGGPETM